MTSPRSVVPKLRILAGLALRDADILLMSASRASRALEPIAMARALRRIDAYRCVLGLPRPLAGLGEPCSGLTRSVHAERAPRSDAERCAHYS